MRSRRCCKWSTIYDSIISPSFFQKIHFIVLPKNTTGTERRSAVMTANETIQASIRHES